MDANARDAYWETQVLTASPQKLRLMLIDGAIRFARQVVQHWAEAKIDEAFTAMTRCQNIVFELMTTVQDNGTELNKTIKGIYLFLYKKLVDCQLQHDSAGVEAVVRVLLEERETWRLLCEKMPEAPSPEMRAARRPAEITAGHMTAIYSSHAGSPGLPNGHLGESLRPASSGSFQLDA